MIGFFIPNVCSIKSGEYYLHAGAALCFMYNGVTQCVFINICSSCYLNIAHGHVAARLQAAEPRLPHVSAAMHSSETPAISETVLKKTQAAFKPVNCYIINNYCIY